MNPITIQSVTADEAVARIVNVDYIPEGFTLLEMTAAFLEDADTDYENARSDHLPEDQKSLLAIRAHICETRHQLAQQLLAGMELELASADCRIVRVDTDTANTAPHFDMASVTDWAFYEFGIGTPTEFDFGRDQKQADVAPGWGDVTITMCEDNKIGVKIGDQRSKKYSYQDVGFMGRKRAKQNILGQILNKLSVGAKYPEGRVGEHGANKNISVIRGCLVKVTRLTGDPFYRFNESDGWKPRFKLVDAQGLVDMLASRRGQSEQYDDTRRYPSAQVDDASDPDDYDQ